MLEVFTPSTGQTTHHQIFGPARADTRIQTHQNLFTLTKNISARQQLSWEQTSEFFRSSTFSGTMI
jgi:hypothetical protein